MTKTLKYEDVDLGKISVSVGDCSYVDDLPPAAGIILRIDEFANNESMEILLSPREAVHLTALLTAAVVEAWAKHNGEPQQDCSEAEEG
jgi:hypothetical protein